MKGNTMSDTLTNSLFLFLGAPVGWLELLLFALVVLQLLRMNGNRRWKKFSKAEFEYIGKAIEELRPRLNIDVEGLDDIIGDFQTGRQIALELEAKATRERADALESKAAGIKVKPEVSGLTEKKPAS